MRRRISILTFAPLCLALASTGEAAGKAPASACMRVKARQENSFLGATGATSKAPPKATTAKSDRRATAGLPKFRLISTRLCPVIVTVTTVKSGGEVTIVTLVTDAPEAFIRAALAGVHVGKVSASKGGKTVKTVWRSTTTVTCCHGNVLPLRADAGRDGSSASTKDAQQAKPDAAATMNAAVKGAALLSVGGLTP